MQPNEEQSNQSSDGRPPMSRDRPLPRRPLQPSSREARPASFPRRANFEVGPVNRPTTDQPSANSQPNYQPEPIESHTEPAPQIVNSAPAEFSPGLPGLSSPTQLSDRSTPPSQVESTGSIQPPSQPTVDRLNFTPPPKKKRNRLLTAAMVTLAVAVLGLALVSFFKAQAARNNPDKAFKDALEHNLTLKKLEAQTTTNDTSGQTFYDFTNPKNTIISTNTSIKQRLGSLNLKGYGSTKNTYISYTKLPKNLKSQVALNTTNGWVQIRINGQLPKNVNPTIFALSDPHYQAFGPLLIGNLDNKTRQQLINFVLQHKVYGYDKNKVTREKINNNKMIIYPIKLDASYLKIANQSSAASQGIDPTEIQLASDNLDQLKGANVTLYINAGDHTFSQIKIVKAGQTKTVSYSHYNNLSLPDEPQTKLMWQNFAPVQAQINSLVNLTNPPY